MNSDGVLIEFRNDNSIEDEKKDILYLEHCHFSNMVSTDNGARALIQIETKKGIYFDFLKQFEIVIKAEEFFNAIDEMKLKECNYIKIFIDTDHGGEYIEDMLIKGINTRAETEEEYTERNKDHLKNKMNAAKKEEIAAKQKYKELKARFEND